MAGAAPDRAFLACSRPGDDEGQALVTLYQLARELRIVGQRTLGFVGRDGRGVDAGLAGTHLHVAYHRGALGDHAVYHAALDLSRGDLGAAPLDAAPLRQRRLSSRERAAADPALLVDAERVYLTWSETLLGLTETRTSLWIARDDQQPRALRDTAAQRPAPHLLRDGRGLLLAYRDIASARPRAALFSTRLRDDLTAVGAARRVGRANSEGPPSVHRCQATFVAVCPLEHGRERYLALHALRPDGTPSGSSHQFYVSGREFVLARAVCSGREVIALAAERMAPPAGGAELVSMRFRCDG